MWPLLKTVFHTMLFDETAARRWVVGLVGALAATGSQLAIGGVDQLAFWTKTQWVLHIAFTLMGFIAGAMGHPTR